MEFFWTYVTSTLLLMVGILLILIVLLQRGRGGGLAGAFGGLGGQSAFGTKAGDVFTKITVVLAVIWVVLAGVTGFAMRDNVKGGFEGGADVGKKDPGISKAVDEKDDAEAAFPVQRETSDDPDGDQGKSDSKNGSGNEKSSKTDEEGTTTLDSTSDKTE